MSVCHYDYMQSDEWKALRKKILKKNNECVVCGVKSNRNQIHHETYDRLGLEGEEDDCIVVCRKHHQGIHNSLNYIKYGWKK